MSRTVATASYAGEAPEALPAQPFDVVVSDERMPGTPEAPAVQEAPVERSWAVA